MATNENKDNLTPAERIASGYTARSEENAATGLTAAELDELKELKSRADAADISPTEMMSLGYQINDLEKKYDTNK